MINDYEFIEHDTEYINDIKMDKCEYTNIIKNVLKKNTELEIENKNYLNNFMDINKKYLNILSDFNILNSNYFQLEKDLSDMELVNLELLKIIKKIK